MTYFSRFLVLALSLVSLQPITAQGYVFGVKGGLTAGSQRWNEGTTYDNSLLFKYHGAVFVENAPENPQSVLFAQVGYHVRGSAFRYRAGVGTAVDGSQVKYDAFTQEFRFNNLALQVGAKRRGVLGQENAYYSVGLRGEYTLSTNLDQSGSVIIFSPYTPVNDFVKKLNFGLSLSGGYEFAFSEFVGAFIEASVHPDITRQYFRPPYVAWDPFQRAQITVEQQSIRNLSFEVTLGFRFLRKIIYVD